MEVEEEEERGVVPLLVRHLDFPTLLMRTGDIHIGAAVDIEEMVVGSTKGEVVDNMAAGVDRWGIVYYERAAAACNNRQNRCFSDKGASIDGGEWVWED